MPPELMAMLAAQQGGGGMPQGGPPQAAQPNSADPNYGAPQLPPELMKMLMQLMSQVPDKPSGGPMNGTAGVGVPLAARGPSGTEQQMAGLLGALQEQQMASQMPPPNVSPGLPPEMMAQMQGGGMF